MGIIVGWVVGGYCVWFPLGKIMWFILIGDFVGKSGSILCYPLLGSGVVGINLGDFSATLGVIS